MDPSVIEAMRRAVAAAPDDPTLRSHLAELLLTADRTSEALEEATTVLGSRPDHLPALGVASAAAERLGRTEQAASYRRLLDALGAGGTPPEDAPTLPPPPEVPDAGSGWEPLAEGAIPGSAEELIASWDGTEAVEEPAVGELSAPGVTLADVGGMGAVKARLDASLFAPLRDPEVHARFGLTTRGGLLLWGPPGCGKTFIARATAGQLGARFYEVGLSDVLDMWVGASERNLHEVFEVARRNRPCVLFFDELDALGQKRSQLRGSAAMRGVVNQLLAELDGASADNEGVFVLGATNHPWDVDSALLRPGRFDRSLLVLPPDAEARAAILHLHLRGKPVERLDLPRLAARADGLSGADLALAVDSATEEAVAASLARGGVQPITQRSLEQALGATRASTGPWFETARSYATYAGEGGAYEELLDYLRRRGR